MQTCKVQPVDQPQASKCSDWALFGTAPNQCKVPAKDRVDCGYPEVTPEQCNNRGCCFDSSISGVPWCFKPLQETGESAPRARGTFPGPQEATHTWALGGTPCATAVSWPRSSVQTLLIPETCSKSRPYGEGTSLKTTLERNGQYVGLESWADFKVIFSTRPLQSLCPLRLATCSRPGWSPGTSPRPAIPQPRPQHEVLTPPSLERWGAGQPLGNRVSGAGCARGICCLGCMPHPSHGGRGGGREPAGSPSASSPSKMNVAT